MKQLSLLSRILVPLTALNLFATACNNKEEVREAPPTVEISSLSLEGFSVNSLASKSADKICENFELFVQDFQKSHLPGVEVTFLGTESKPACRQEVNQNRVDTELNFNLKNAQTSINLRASFFMHFDEEQNFMFSSAYLGRIENQDSSGSTELLSKDKLIGANIDHFKKTLELWTAPSHKKMTLHNRSFDEAVAAFNKHYGVGNSNVMINDPILRVELIPSATNPSNGTVKFLEVGADNFLERRTRTGTEKTYLLCADIECLSSGVSYQIIANRIVFTSKNIPISEGSAGYRTTKQSYIIETSDLD
ncbi:MAG: hypothetical protein EOP07_10060 [Proteobacteria bacterium]|nr:MAG: hypothetical protein EOP07_10060 [Pseudomonadota bacterium]